VSTSAIFKVYIHANLPPPLVDGQDGAFYGLRACEPIERGLRR
jgi:hypothetical protein